MTPASHKWQFLSDLAVRMPEHNIELEHYNQASVIVVATRKDGTGEEKRTTVLSNANMEDAIRHCVTVFTGYDNVFVGG